MEHRKFDGSRVFSRAHAPCSLFEVHGFSFATWNCRALAHRTEEKMRAKVKSLRAVLQAVDICVLQETHCPSFEADRILAVLRKDWLWKCGSGDSRNAGGTIVLARRRLFSQPSDFVVEHVVPGRVDRMVAQAGGKKCIVWNIHNFGLSDRDKTLINAALDCDRKASVEAPGDCVLWVGGDFNFSPDGMQDFSLRNPTLAQRSLSRRHAAEARHWPALLHLTELDARGPTHVAKPADELCVLDRVFTALPSWSFTLLDGQISVKGDPVSLHRAGVSDHAPVIVKLFFGKARTGRAPIPKHIVQHCTFPEKLQRLERQTELAAYVCPFERLEVHKECIRRAAAEVKQELLIPTKLHGVDDTASLEAKRGALAHLAKIVWSNDASRARTLLRRCPLARRFLGVVPGSGQVSLTDPVAFATAVDESRRRDTAGVGGDGARQARGKGSGAGSNVLMRLWRSTAKVATLAAIVCPAGERATTVQQMTAALRDHWAPTFSQTHTNFDHAEAASFLQRWSPCLAGEDVRAPSKDNYADLIARMAHAAPGPDGVPYSAWCAAGSSGVDTLFAAGSSLQCGIRPPRAFNAQLAIFIPKDVPAPDLDPTRLDREPGDTRPLALKNCDAKLITAVACRAAKKVLAKRTCQVQRGFVPGRQLLSNVIDIDAAGRKFGLPPKRIQPGVPCIALLDFAAAFPSVAHIWIWSAIEALQLPGGFVELLKGVYFDNVAFTRDGAGLVELYAILSGILQGCPGSGHIFTWCLDPFLFCLEATIGQRGIVRACADDVSLAMRCIRDLVKVEEIYRCIARLTLLQVKPRKCVIIPTREALTPALRRAIREWLKRVIPAWASFAVEKRGKLLGVVLGPSAGEIQWQSVEAKYESRLLDIARSGAPPSIAIRLHSTFAVPTLGYLAQVLPPPAQTLKSQLARYHALCHLPMNCFSLAVACKMAEVGGPKYTSLKAYAFACAIRTACCSIDSWEGWCSDLRDTAGNVGDAVRWANGIFWPEGWDTEPLAWRMRTVASPPLLRKLGEKKVAAGLEEFFEKWKIRGPDWRRRARAVTDFQKKLYATLVGHLHPEPIGPFFLRSLHRYGVWEASAQDVTRSLQWLKGLRPEVVWASLLTWAGGWPTGRRMQDKNALGVRCTPCCAFGCAAGEDALQHYVRCPALWALISRSSPPGPASARQFVGIASSTTSKMEARRLAARVGATLHGYRTIRLARVGQPCPHRQVFKAAAHKFSCATGERFGVPMS